MQIIKFKEDQKGIWNKFITENNSESFLQAWEWGEFQKNIDRKIFKIGVISKSFKESDKKISSGDLLAVALIIKYDLPFGQSYLYCPRGPIIKVSSIKYQVSSILNFLFNEIEKIGKKEKTMFLKIDPPAELNRELETPPLKKGVGGIFKKSLNEIQPRNTLILDLTKSEEELSKEMKPKTRYNIRLAKKKGVDIGYWILDIENQESFKKSFEKFWELAKETSRRDKFASHNKNYYWKMLESLNGIHTPSPSQGGNTRTFNFSQEENNLNRLQAKLYLAEYKNRTIAANIVLSFSDFCVYLHGASSNEHRNVMAPYLLQWRQILDAKKTGCKSYDFWGIENSQKSIKSVKLKVHKIKSDWSGITRFKKGFGGKEKNYIGAYDLVFSDIGYPIYKFVKFVKSKVKS